MTRLVRLVVACLCLFVAPSVFAQSPYTGPGYELPPDCTPYDVIGCPGAGPTPANNPVTNPGDAAFVGATIEIDFPQVFLGAPGLEQTYVSIKSKVDDINVVTIEVTMEGTAPITRVLTLGPQARQSVKLNDWPELAGITAGVSIVVRAQRAATAGVAMHPSNPATFWSGARILEGR
jgi:hypothetical protein